METRETVNHQEAAASLIDSEIRNSVHLCIQPFAKATEAKSLSKDIGYIVPVTYFASSQYRGLKVAPLQSKAELPNLNAQILT